CGFRERVKARRMKLHGKGEPSSVRSRVSLRLAHSPDGLRRSARLSWIQFAGGSPVEPSAGFVSGGTVSGGASTLFSSTAACGGGGLSFSSFALKNAANSPSVRSGALPSFAASDSFGIGASRFGLRGSGGGGGGAASRRGGGPRRSRCGG